MSFCLFYSLSIYFLLDNSAVPPPAPDICGIIFSQIFYFFMFNLIYCDILLYWCIAIRSSGVITAFLSIFICSEPPFPTVPWTEKIVYLHRHRQMLLFMNLCLTLMYWDEMFLPLYKIPPSLIYIYYAFLRICNQLSVVVGSRIFFCISAWTEIAHFL